jgi:tetratricopeptide (TPR) repeat protein
MRSALFLTHLLAVAPVALGGAAKAEGSGSADELIKKGDVYYAKLNPTEALRFYLPAEKIDPNNVGLLVRISRQYRHLMSECGGKEDKLKFGQTAVSYSQKAVALAPNNPDAQLSVAISYGKVLPYQATKDQIAGSRVIKAAADKTLALDPRNDLAWQVLGRWYLNVADVSTLKRAVAQVVYGSLPTAKYEDAVGCFEKAIKLNPNRLMHYIELGRTYAQMGNTEDAKKFISKGLSMPNTEKDDPEVKEQGRVLLAKLR